MAHHHSPAFLAIVNDAKKRVKEADFRDIKKRLDAGEKMILVDTREDNEWAKGHIPGAKNFSRGTVELEIEEAAPDLSTPIITHCGGGGRSALAAESLRRMGYKNVRSMAGGFKAWKAAGLPASPD